MCTVRCSSRLLGEGVSGPVEVSGQGVSGQGGVCPGVGSVFPGDVSARHHPLWTE